MSAVSQLPARLRQARLTGRGLLVLYLTLADPLTSQPDLAPALVDAGADVLELGLPTPSARPRGTAIAESFVRAPALTAAHAWQDIKQLRRTIPDIPVIVLCYPETIADIGWPELVRGARNAGVDGIVLTQPTEWAMRRLVAAEIAAIPVLTPSTPYAHRLENLAGQLTYRTLAARTGEHLRLDRAVQVASTLAAEATKPFLLGFGIRTPAEISALSHYAAGVVIGSQLLRVIVQSPAAARVDRAAEAVRSWRAALGGANQSRQSGQVP